MAEFIQAEEVREAASKVREAKRLEHLNKVKEYAEYQELVDKIQDAASDGLGSIAIYPIPEEEYNSYIENNQLIPEEAKRFSSCMRETLNSLREYGGFNVAYSGVPVIYDDMGNSTRIEMANITWG